MCVLVTIKYPCVIIPLPIAAIRTTLFLALSADDSSREHQFNTPSAIKAHGPI